MNFCSFLEKLLNVINLKYQAFLFINMANLLHAAYNCFDVITPSGVSTQSNNVRQTNTVTMS